ncbi:MAG: DUF262 domain-containing protein [Lachnospiraceae bacterium]|nr:DUF262 domain-containing protein [Lachnospiraceae bacterium]
MDSSQHTFIDIFTKPLLQEGEEILLKSVTIPIIQRDYAQGRENAKRVRTRFLESLYKAVVEKPITLDFVYGAIKDGVLTPLDGQQRLTTLFLLHWYIAKKEDVSEEKYSFLRKFSYMTRYSARDFCAFLVGFKPDLERGHFALSEQIIDQSWFPFEWKKDPTIASMLVMLDAIDSVFYNTTGVWEKLQEGAISFYFLSITKLGLTDDIYIKMNSRGKPLTLFEHFKAELEREMKKVSSDVCNRIMGKIDNEWTDLLWKYCVHKDTDASGDEEISVDVIDDKFMRYFRFVCDILCYRAGGTLQGKVIDEFQLIKEYFSCEASNAIQNMEQLESYFDCWCKIDGNAEPWGLAEKFMSHEHEEGKIEIRYDIDIFKSCIDTYSDRNGRNRKFPLGRIIILHAFVEYLKNQKTITESEFSRRLRIVNNLVQNSENEISDSEARQSGNRMPAILKQIDEIIVRGNVDDTITNGLNTYQLSEEKEKLEWTTANPDKAEVLYGLEDHRLLQGQIWILGLSKIGLGNHFKMLFDCDWNLVNQVLMTYGNYAQKENSWRYQLGSGKRKNVESWRNLFHKSNNENSDATRSVLIKLLEAHDEFTDEILQNDIDQFLKEQESKSLFDWRYYYIKYPVFRPDRYGKYWWRNAEEDPYDIMVMTTPLAVSEYTYQPFLKAIKDAIDKEDRDRCLDLGDRHIRVAKAAYVVYDAATETEIDRVVIAHNDQGIDTENRIEKMKTYLGL